MKRVILFIFIMLLVMPMIASCGGCNLSGTWKSSCYCKSTDSNRSRVTMLQFPCFELSIARNTITITRKYPGIIFILITGYADIQTPSSHRSLSGHYYTATNLFCKLLTYKKMYAIINTGVSLTMGAEGKHLHPKQNK